MKKWRDTKEQIAFALRQAGTPAAEATRRMNVSEQTFYLWKKVYGELGVCEPRRVKELEDENRKLKQPFADLSLAKHILARSFDAWVMAGDRRACLGVHGVYERRSWLVLGSSARRCATFGTSLTKRRCGCASLIWRRHECAMPISDLHPAAHGGLAGEPQARLSAAAGT